jgi:hypothetical protein
MIRLRSVTRAALAALTLLTAGAGKSLAGDDSERLLTVDHYVTLKSTVPAIAGQTSTIYVREKVQAGPALRSATLADRVVLFVHGAGTPAEVAFDVPFQDYSWMAYLAQAGYDVFSMDTTGYGRSTRPAPMNDPCNLAKDRQVPFAPAPCAPSYPHQLTTIQSDWDDIGAAVDYVRALRHVDKVSLLPGRSAARARGLCGVSIPKRCRSSCCSRRPTTAARPHGAAQMRHGAAFNTQSRDDFAVNWDRQVGCSDQYERGTSDAVWTDDAGVRSGRRRRGGRRAPRAPDGAYGDGRRRWPEDDDSDADGRPAYTTSRCRRSASRNCFADLGATQKVFVDLACSSHNAMWEKNHLLLFRASLEWLTSVL